MTNHGDLPDTARLVHTDALQDIGLVGTALVVADVACELGSGNRVVWPIDRADDAR